MNEGAGKFFPFHSMKKKKKDPQHLKPLEEHGTQTNFSSLTLMNIFLFKSINLCLMNILYLTIRRKGSFA